MLSLRWLKKPLIKHTEDHFNEIFYLLAAFVFGTIACINPWDMPVYALLLGVALLLVGGTIADLALAANE